MKRDVKYAGDSVLWSRGAYPVGVVYAARNVRGLADVFISAAVADEPFERRLSEKYGTAPVRDDVALKEVFGWLDSYFAGVVKDFPLALDAQGTDFDRSVWRAVSAIPRSTVATYGDVAEAIGRPRAFRAAAGACGRNPLPIVVPCHRVVSANGPGGYTGGVRIKKLLLGLEGVRLGGRRVRRGK